MFQNYDVPARSKNIRYDLHKNAGRVLFRIYLTVVVEIWLDIGDLNIGLLRVELGELHLLRVLDDHQIVHSVFVSLTKKKMHKQEKE